ncbi:hypothetical protein FRB97_000058 [Tulasnella sp. 331]|nr:hypothetical protein FRB97_000058 [Tulasnella sp. 331]
MSDDEEIPELIEHDSLPVKPETAPPAKVPLTIITGFLGAGKSTLLQYILTAKHGYRIAVIMNEFGDTADIEGNAVANAIGRKIDVSSTNAKSNEALSEEFLEVANGCLCCSIKDTGAASIELLMKKRGRFDYILLETTGLADPGPIASIFWHNEDLSEDILLDGVVSVVDGVFGLDQIEKDKASGEVKESLRQVACADIILLNKVDLAPVEVLSKLEATIRGINPVAAIERTIKGNIDLGKILDLNAYSNRPEFNTTEFAAESAKHEFGGAHDNENIDEGHNHNDSCSHLNDITSLLIPLPILSTSQHEAVDGWIRSVLWDNHIPGDTTTGADGSSLEILRCKGVWHTEDKRIFVLQGVRSLYETSEVATNTDEPPVGKIVLIGKGLDKSVYNSLASIVS